jgi:hypothetical protein
MNPRKNRLLKDGGVPTAHVSRLVLPQEPYVEGYVGSKEGTGNLPPPWDYFGETYVLGVFAKRCLVDQLLSNFELKAPRLRVDHVLLEPITDVTPGELLQRDNLTMRYRDIFQDALDRGVSSCLMFEDDARWVLEGEELEERVREIVDVLERTPDWNIFFFGSMNIMPLVPVSKHVFCTGFPQTTHAYAISKEGLRRAVDRFNWYLDLRERSPRFMPILPCDTLLNTIPSRKLCVVPELATQCIMPRCARYLDGVVETGTFFNGITYIVIGITALIFAGLVVAVIVGAYFVAKAVENHV